MGIRESDQLNLIINGQPIPAASIQREFISTGRAESQGRELPPYWIYSVANPLGARWGDNELAIRLTSSSPQADSGSSVVAEEFNWNVTPTDHALR